MRPELAVPPIYSPIPPAIHPSHPAINAQTTAWAEAIGIGSDELRDRLVQHDIGTFAARVLPDGREAVIGILSDFVLWLFGVDDGYCEEGELGRRPGALMAALQRLLRIAQNPEAPMLLDDPLAGGLRDLQRRISQHGSVGQTALWVNALREYFSTVVWEAEHRSTGTVPDLNDYTLMRLYDGATTVVLPLLEMGHGYVLQADERDQKPVRAAAEMASFIITWDNDLFSHHKESRGPGYYLNVVRVLEHEYQLSPSQALDLAIAQRDRVMRLFLRLHERLLPAASPQLRQYLHNLRTFIRGAQDWGISSVRYTTPEDPASLPTAFRETPTDTSDKPLDIPAIAWWWDLDLLAEPHLAGATQAAGSPPSPRQRTA
ncbi:selina-4(15),7(11)-diene synthase [Streptomyces lunaelactis]|uniref:selina-4(15),7(11)-diene synthase n=1 Tax=Streptomyces lunaelactis TaxID=1535768 RepID=UPI00211D4D69|nr:selina-4(15),7(11)-diene synthase [Streptomyces lunaelactis]